MKIINLFIGILLFFWCQIIHSQIEVSNFDNLTHYAEINGLSSNIINDVLEDNNGFLWIANNKGLSRFDGLHFKNIDYYYGNNVKEYKIGAIEKLVIDKSNNTLWASGEKGLFYTSLDSVTSLKKFSVFSSNSKLPLKRIVNLIIGEQNVLWASSPGKGLIKVNVKSGNYKNYIFKTKATENKTLLNSINSICKDPINKSILWLGTGAGIVKFNTITEDYQVYVYQNNSDLAQNLTRKILVTKEYVFIGTWSKGLVVFNKKNKIFSQPIIESFKNSFLILDFYKDNDYLWITTNEAIIQFDISSQLAVKSSYNKFNKGIIKGVSYVDSKGIIWYCHGKGLFKYNPLISQNKFIELEVRTKLEVPLHIREIILMNDFIYVLGHGGSGLYKINPIDYSFETIKISPNERSNFNLRDMVKMDDENLLVISYNKSYIFNTKSQKTSLSPLQVNHSSPSLQSIVKDKNGIYWVGGRLSGLTSLNFKKNTTNNYKKEFNLFNEGNHIWINKLYIDGENKLWIAKGTSSVMNLDNHELSLLNPKDSLPYYQDASGFFEDNTGRVWVANYKNGLGFINYEKFNRGISHQYNGSFNGIYKYTDSTFWATGKGYLGEFNIINNTHTTYNINSNKHFIRGPIIKKNNEEFIIGCDNGILIYKTETSETDNSLPNPYIRKITGNGNLVYQGNTLSNKTINFKSTINNLVIYVSALGYQQTNQLKFKYKFQDKWIPLGSSKEINISNLSSGSYHFNIKVCNNLDNCNIVEYQFIISTPWYKTWWAFSFYSVLIFSIVFLLYKFNLNKKLAIAEKQNILELDKLKTELYTNISHEIRTPLTIITGLSQILIDDNKKDSEKLKGILNSGNQLLKLVNQILGLSSLDAKKTPVNYINADVIQFIEKCVSLFKFYADSKQQQLTFHTSTSSLFMDFDDDKIQKIINNLLSNAIKFTPENGIITVKVFENKDHLELKISDNGNGIDPKHLPHIFERYYKTSENNVGSGIGMEFTKKLVTLLKGTITVKSTLKKGTSFTITLPKTSLKSNNTKVTHQVPIIDTLSQTNKNKDINLSKQSLYTVLIVEDNKEIRGYIKLLLEEKYKIVEANNGIEGLRKLKIKKIDFIISDIVMPLMDGLEFCKQIKNNIDTSHIPFIIISAKTEIKDRLKGHELGIDAYLTKPFNKAELYLIIENLLQKKQEQLNYFGKLLELKNVNPSQYINQIDLHLIAHLQEQVLGNNKNLSVDELAKLLGTSRTQLHRKITSITGMSVTRYINHIRIEKAKILLLETNLHINEIAYNVGFESAAYFSRIFKKELGITPVKYRQNQS